MSVFTVWYLEFTYATRELTTCVTVFAMGRVPQHQEAVGAVAHLDFYRVPHCRTLKLGNLCVKKYTQNEFASNYGVQVNTTLHTLVVIVAEKRNVVRDRGTISRIRLISSSKSMLSIRSASSRIKYFRERKLNPFVFSR